MHIAHPVITGLFMVVGLGFLLQQALRKGRLILRGPGPTIDRRRHPVHFWSAIVFTSLLVALGFALIFWGAFFAP